MGWLSKMLGLDRPIAAPPKPKRVPAKPSPLAGVQGLRVVGKGGYPRNVVGESNYQAHLKRICGGHNRHGHELETIAQLVPEPTNAYDPKAVMVRISDRKIGYLSRDDAVVYGAALAAAGYEGRSAQVAAKIVGGWKTNQHDAGHFGVRLGLPFPVRFEA